MCNMSRYQTTTAWELQYFVFLKRKRSVKKIQSVTNKMDRNQRLNLDAQHYVSITCCTEAKEDKDGPIKVLI